MNIRIVELHFYMSFMTNTKSEHIFLDNLLPLFKMALLVLLMFIPKYISLRCWYVSWLTVLLFLSNKEKLTIFFKNKCLTHTYADFKELVKSNDVEGSCQKWFFFCCHRAHIELEWSKLLSAKEKWSFHPTDWPYSECIYEKRWL